MKKGGEWKIFEMKNIINFNLDFSKIPNSEKKFLYIHNDIYTDLKNSEKIKDEKLVKLENSQIKIDEFLIFKFSFRMVAFCLLRSLLGKILLKK